MKLTNSIKDSIIYAVMKDTPEEYSSEQAHKDALAICVANMPPKIKSLWDNKETRDWIKTEYTSGFQGYLPTKGNNYVEFSAIVERHKLSKNARINLKSHVRNVVYQFSTDKQMRDSIPELDKYIPKEVVKIKNLPIINGIMDELTKAGFPIKK